MAQTKQKSLRVGPQGRVVIPAHIRRSLDIESGDTLIATVNDGQIVLEKPEKVLARLRTTFDGVPDEVSLADQLVAERREEAKKEDQV